MAPLVSILMPVYNRADFLPMAIESVLAQDMTDLELIVSNNVSTDASPEIVQRYAKQDRRIKVFHNDVHVSAVENFNLCYQRSDPNSTYIALLATDDWWKPTLLSRLLAVAEKHPSATFVYADMYRANRDGKVINRYSELYQHVTPAPGLHCAVCNLYHGNYVNIMAALIHRQKKQEIFPTEWILDPSLKLTPDYALWLQLLTRGAITYYLDVPLAYYRRHADSMTTEPRNLIPRLLEEITIFREKLCGICPPDLEAIRRDALQERLAQIGFELLKQQQADEAMPFLSEADVLSSWRRLDVTVARLIASLPMSVSQRTRIWQLSLMTTQLRGRVS